MVKIHPLKRIIGRYHLLANVLPLTISVGFIKFGFHSFGWEQLPSSMLPFITSVLTGIIFFFGFILAGIVSDFKDSEKIPSEMVVSLYTIWREAENLANEDPELTDGLKKKIYIFVDRFKSEFLIRRVDDIFDLLDSFSDDFRQMDRKVPPPLMVRLRNEQSTLWRLLTRIKVIRSTSFSESGYLAIRAITILFIFALMLLKADPFLEGAFFVCLYTFILFSIILLIQDMDDPFEYEEGEKGVDEVNFDVLYDFGDRLKRKMSAMGASSIGTGNILYPGSTV